MTPEILAPIGISMMLAGFTLMVACWIDFNKQLDELVRRYKK